MNVKVDIGKAIERDVELFDKTGVAIFGRERWEHVKSKRGMKYKLKQLWQHIQVNK